MKLAVVRGLDPNLSEMTSYRGLPAHGIDVALHAEWSRVPGPDAERAAGVPLRPYRGLDHAFGWVPRRLRPLARFAMEQVGGVIAPLPSADIIGDADVVNVSDLTPFHVAQLARRGRAQLTVTLWENVPDRERRALLGPWVVGTSAPRVARYLAVSEYAAMTARLAGVPADRIAVVPLAVDVERFAPRAADPALRAALGVREDDRLVLFSGRLQWSKGVDTLLYAMAGLRLLAPALAARTVLAIVGHGRHAGRARALAARLGLADRVRFVGAVPFAQVPAYYNAADLFVLPSTVMRWWQEQLGFVLLEAMASGVPIVTTHAGAIPEVVGDTARLVAPSHHLQLAEALRDLLADDGLCQRMGEAGRARALERNHPARVDEAMARFFAGVG